MGALIRGPRARRKSLRASCNWWPNNSRQRCPSASWPFGAGRRATSVSLGSRPSALGPSSLIPSPGRAHRASNPFAWRHGQQVAAASSSSELGPDRRTDLDWLGTATGGRLERVNSIFHNELVLARDSLPAERLVECIRQLNCDRFDCLAAAKSSSRTEPIGSVSLLSSRPATCWPAPPRCHLLALQLAACSHLLLAAAARRRHLRWEPLASRKRPLSATCCSSLSSLQFSPKCLVPSRAGPGWAEPHSEQQVSALI